jgi:uncharacterized damage-inducible protein DinB
MNRDAGVVFLHYCGTRLETLTSWIDNCLGRLTLDQIWLRGETQNAIGNLVVHLCGNVRERITVTLGQGGPTARDRNAEFDPSLRHTAEELRRQLNSTTTEAVAVLREFPAERLTTQTPKPGYDRLVLENIFTVVEHFAVHTGQIMFATKQMTQRDLGEMTRSGKPKPVESSS